MNCTSSTPALDDGFAGLPLESDTTCAWLNRFSPMRTKEILTKYDFLNDKPSQFKFKV